MNRKLKVKNFVIENEESNSSYQYYAPRFIALNDTSQGHHSPKELNDKHDASHIMTITRKSVDDTNDTKAFNTLGKQNIYDSQNLIPRFQSNIFNKYDTQIKKGVSYSVLTKYIDYQRKKKKATTATKYTRPQKVTRKTTTFPRPPWILPKENLVENKHLTKRSIKRTSISCKPLENPCQTLQSYTELKPTQHRSYECICTSLPPCSTPPSCSFICNTQICNLYRR